MNPSRALNRGASRISHTASSRTSQPTTTRPPPPTHMCARSISQSLTRRSTSDSHPPPPPSIPPTTTSFTPADPLHQVFSHPTWSIRSSLLPTTSSNSHPDPEAEAEAEAKAEAEAEAEAEITPKTLAHHLRLSALPPPSSSQEEARLLATLRTQLRFVRAVQAVAEAPGVEPLRAIRDETSAGAAEATLGLDALRGALARETRFGFRGRPRRSSRGVGVVGGGKGGGETEGCREERSEEERLVESATAGRRERGYYVVESGKAKGGE